MDEIKDTETDRRALRLLLRAFPQTGVDIGAASLGLLNETWARMARAMAAAPPERFDTLEADLRDRRDVLTGELAERKARMTSAHFPDEERDLAGHDRALELLGLIVEWRGETWAAAEIAAGRDPHVAPHDVWTPPDGWIPPAKTGR